MYWLDTTILVAVALAALLGGRTGFLTQVARILALAVAGGATIVCNPWVAPWLQETVLSGAPTWAARSAAYLGVFLVTYALLWGLTSLIQRSVEAARMRWLDRVLGAVFAVAKAGLLLGAIFLGLSTFAADAVQGTFEKSFLVPWLSDGVDRLVGTIPENYRDELSARLRPPTAEEVAPLLPSLPPRK